MITLNYDGKSHELRNEPGELKLAEFEKIFNIVNAPGNKEKNVQKYFEVFEFLGVPDEILDAMDQEDFIKAVQQFNDYEIDNTAPRLVNVGKRTYEVYPEGEEFKFKARDIALIEHAAGLGDGHFPSLVLAILFKDTELTTTEHKDWAHIKHKAKLFRNELTAKEAVPYLSRLARRQVQVLDKMNEDAKS